MTRTLALALGATLLLAVTGCPADDDTDPTDVDTDTDTDTEAQDPLVTVEGSTSELFSQQAAPEGLCAVAVEPSEALGGGELTVLGQSTVDANGNFSIADVNVDDAPLAIFVVLQDCGNEGTAFPTGTGVAAEDYADLEFGDTLTRDSIWISTTSQQGIDGSLAAVGSTKTMADGMVFALVTNAQGAPAAGAQVSCEDSENLCDTAEFYYVDGDPSDGLFSTAGAVNDSIVGTVGLAAIPEGPVGNYTATDPDGNLTFGASLFGSIAGLASFTQISAE